MQGPQKPENFVRKAKPDFNVDPNDAQKNAARRVEDGAHQSTLPIAEQHAGEDCDSSLEDQN